jgi:hypothetical protein
MTRRSWKVIPAALGVVASLLGVQTLRAAPTHEKVINSGNERPWCAVVSLEPLTVAYLQAQLQRPARHEMGDFEYANVENRTA